MKSLLGAQVKQLTCCVPTKFQKDSPKPCEEEEGLVARMRRKWSSDEQYQESLEVEK